MIEAVISLPCISDLCGWFRTVMGDQLLFEPAGVA